MGLHFLGDMNTTQVKELREKTRLAIIPVGPTEVHGRHLPMKADSACAKALASATASKLEDIKIDCIIAPTVNQAVADFVNDEVGNISIGYETMVCLIRDICVGLAKWNFDRILIVSGHAEPRNTEAMTEGIRMACAINQNIKGHVSEWFGKCLPQIGHICKSAHPEWDLHAGEIETAQLMYLCPHLVDERVARTLEPNVEGEFLFERISNGAQSFADCGALLSYFGEPAIATRETGRRLFDFFSDFIVEEAKTLLIS